MKTSSVRNLAVAFFFLGAGGVAAISIRYPDLWAAVECLFIGIVLAVAGTWWWVSRKHRTPKQPPVRRLTRQARRELRRDLLLALGIGFASVVGLVVAIEVASNLFGRDIPVWLAMVATVAWFGVTLVVATPCIKRVSHILASQIELRGEDDEQGQDEA